MKLELGALALALAALVVPAVDPQAGGAPAQDAAPAPAGPVVGKPAPSFRLNDHEAEVVAVGGARDHWTVLAFFPKAATPG